MSGPDFRDLIGEDLPATEEARLRRVHDLLLQAGPPPELPPSLVDAPSERGGELIGFPRRRLLAGLVLAAALAAAAFGGGYVAGHGSSGKGFATKFALPMHGTSAAPRATAALELANAEAGGNVPVRMVVQGLPTLPKNGYYELYLTRRGRTVASCGTFRVRGGQTVVRLNAPYLIPRGQHPGWVVVAHAPGRSEAQPLLMT